MVKKRGPIWNHWTEINNGSNNANADKPNSHPSVQCNYCSKLFKRAVPERMQDHIDKCRKAPNSAKSQSRQKTLESLLAEALLSANMPLSFVENPLLVQFFQHLQPPSFKLPNKGELEEAKMKVDDNDSCKEDDGDSCEDGCEENDNRKSVVTDYNLTIYERKKKYKDYDLVLCEKCNKETSDDYSYICYVCYINCHDNRERKRMNHGICRVCFQIKTFNNYFSSSCMSCHLQEDFNEWTSGNKIIDELIQDIQFSDSSVPLEWIPYNKFTDIAKGGPDKEVYSATWIDGYIVCWNRYINNWKRSRPCKVVLKVFNDSSENISENFLNEIKTIHEVYKKIGLNNIVNRCYGITKDPNTQNYALVFEFLENGNLHSYINHSITWNQKLVIISNIMWCLYYLHDVINMIHKNLHSGNILFTKFWRACFNNVGFCKPANEDSTNSKEKKIHGVMPYMAPEILHGKNHTKASNIYSIGIIINHIISEIPPFNNRPHDYYLAMDICCGLRPKISEETPEFLKEIIQKCWDAIPENRPTSEEIYSKLIEFETSEQYNEPIIATNLLSKTQLSDTHPQAIYTSQTFNLPDLPEPVNCKEYENILMF